MANLFSSGAPQFFPSSAAILLVVWFANDDCSASSKVDLLNDDLPMWFCDHNYVILRTNRARCALNKEILDLHNEESVSEVRSFVELVYKSNEKSTTASVRKGKSTAKVPFKLFWGVIHTHTHTHTYLNGHQPWSHNSCSRIRVQGNKSAV